MTQRNKAGGYYRPHPLDFELLRRMPVEGTMLGYHVLAMTVSHVRRELNRNAPAGAQLTAEQIASRLRSMRTAGYCVTAVVIGGQGWQRTKSGERFYEEQTGEKLGEPGNHLKMIEGGQA